ncbi:MAG: hypothetical protein ACRDPT_03205 [Streptomycetales bacterium]
MTTYRIMIRREHPWWVAFAEGVPGSAVEARGLGHLFTEIREGLADLLDIEPESLDLSPQFDLPLDAKVALDELREARWERERAERRYEARMHRAAQVLGESVRASARDAAELMGISHQRVSQLRSGKARRAREVEASR